MIDLIENVENQSITLEKVIDNINSIFTILSEKKQLIIPDTNIIIDNEFLSSSYSKRNYHEIKDYELEELKKSLEFGTNVVTNTPNLFIASNLVEEVNEFHRIFSERVKYYNHKDINFIKNHKNSERYYTRKEICQQLTQLSFDLTKMLKKSVYIPQNKELYDNLNFVICGITKSLGSKRENNKNLGPKSYRKENEKFKTDEEIVALAYYLMMKEQKNCSIISGDSDIYRILKDCTRFIKSRYGNSEDLKLLLKKYTISVYNQITNSSGKRDVKEPILITSEIEDIIPYKHEKILFRPQ